MKILKILTTLLAISAVATMTSCNSPKGAMTYKDDGRYPEYFGGQGNPNNPNDYVPRDM